MEDVIVVGGGIIGLLTARELLNSGLKVKLIDKQAPGQEASWAGGGIVSPLYPWNYDDAITELVVWAQAYYPELAKQLYQETGIDPEFNPTGLFLLDSDEHDKALAWATRTEAHLVNARVSEVYKKIPNLRAGFKKALSMPDVGNVRNPRLLKALVKSLKLNKDFELVVDEPVQSILQNAGKVVGVKTNKQNHHAERVLVSAGAWSPLLLDACNIELVIEPVRGEMLVFQPKHGLLSSIVLHNGKYLIPRKDGRIVVGSTTEKVGYNKQATAQGKEALIAAAFDILPSLESVSIEKHWAGLRPGAPAGLPYMGESPEIDGLFVCAGHYRNGLVTAPASARLMADLMQQKVSEISSDPFRLDREVITAEMY